MESSMPEEFVFLKQIDPEIIQNLRYGTKDNFTGTVIKGYQTLNTSNNAVVTKKCAEKLKNISKRLQKDGFYLVLYDSYRPQRAVNYFIEWSELHSLNPTKDEYYPRQEKINFFRDGYLAKRSGHSRGSTVDVSFIKIGKKLLEIPNQVERNLPGETEFQFIYLDDGTQDFGTAWDFMDQSSAPDSNLVDEEVVQRRKYLADIMKEEGFQPCTTEWWHFTVIDEDFPSNQDQSYFDFIPGQFE